MDDWTASGAAPFSISLVPKVWRSQWCELRAYAWFLHETSVNFQT